MSEFERPSDASAQARPRADVDAGVGVEDLPRIDEHTITIRVDDPMLVWNTLGEVIGRLWRVPSLGTRLLQAEPAIRSGDPLLAGSTLPGFTVVRAEPGKELALGGHHRFSSYALIFRLVAGERHTTLSAETRATFPRHRRPRVPQARHRHPWPHTGGSRPPARHPQAGAATLRGSRRLDQPACAAPRRSRGGTRAASFYHQRRVRHPSLVGVPVACKPEQPLDEPLPAQRRAHLDTQMDGFGAGIPGHVGNARRSDNDLARAGGPLDPSDTKAHAAGDDLPALLHLGMDVLRRAMPGPRPEIVHLQQPPIGIGCICRNTIRSPLTGLTSSSPALTISSILADASLSPP